MKLGLRPQDQDTICALASPPGEGAIALVRISGRKAFSIGRKICPFLPPHPQSHKLYYGTVLNFQKSKLMKSWFLIFRRGDLTQEKKAWKYLVTVVTFYLLPYWNAWFWGVPD